MSTWILCKDEIPPQCLPVLCCVTEAGHAVVLELIEDYENGITWVYWSGSGDYVEYELVHAWQKLPDIL